METARSKRPRKRLEESHASHLHWAYAASRRGASRDPARAVDVVVPDGTPTAHRRYADGVNVPLHSWPDTAIPTFD